MFLTLARGAADVGGGAPLGEDFGIAAEAVADGAVEALDEEAGFLDEGADAGGGACVGLEILVLLGAETADGLEVVPKVLDEVRIHGEGGEFGDDGAVREMGEEGFGVGEDLALGVRAEGEGGIEAGVSFEGDGAGGGGDGFKVLADFFEEGGLGRCGGAGGVTGLLVGIADFLAEGIDSGEVFGSLAASGEGGGVLGAEGGNAVQCFGDGVFFVVHVLMWE